MTVSNGLMQHNVRQPDSAPEELHYWTPYSRIHCSFRRTPATVHIPNWSVRSFPPEAMTYICHSLHAPHSRSVLLLWMKTTWGSCAYTRKRWNRCQYKGNSSDSLQRVTSKQEESLHGLQIYKDLCIRYNCSVSYNCQSHFWIPQNRASLSPCWYENIKLLWQLELQISVCTSTSLYTSDPMLLELLALFLFCLPGSFQSSWISVQWIGKRTWQQTPGWPCWRCSWGSSRTHSFCGETNAQKAQYKLLPVREREKASVFI